MYKANFGFVHPAYNPSFSACFFSRNSIFLSQQISQQCFLAGLSAQPNGHGRLSCACDYLFTTLFILLTDSCRHLAIGITPVSLPTCTAAGGSQ
jgi:hypothetical protein